MHYNHTAPTLCRKREMLKLSRSSIRRLKSIANQLNYPTMALPKLQKVALAKQLSESPAGIEYADAETPQITGPSDVIVKNRYSGVNFIEAYFRKGIYPAQFPLIFGREASGEVVAVGEDVSEYKVGDKVAYLSPKTLAQYTKVSKEIVTIKKLSPDASDDDLKKWAAILLQGLTAITLAHEAYAVQKGDFVLVWAAAGGVGQILTKYVTSLGGRVIAIASTADKLQIAKNLGAEFLIRSDADIPSEVLKITNNVGVAVSYDGVGKDSFEASLASVARKGTLVSYGNASGAVPPFSINRLSQKNLKIARPTLFGYVSDPNDWKKYTDLLQDSLADKSIDIAIYKTYPLSDYRQAAEDLESRKTTGKLVIEIP